MLAYGWSKREALCGKGGAENWVWYNYALEQEHGAFGPLWRTRGRNYLGQERDAVVARRKAANEKR